jgi:hemerythrin-like domain-containing protein
MARSDTANMMPVAPLMIEHRLIERMVGAMHRELESARRRGQVDPAFIETAVDFMRTYADAFHHGKEEEILFRDLATKQLEPEHKRTMDDLVEQHVFARKTVGDLVAAKDRYRQGDRGAAAEVAGHLETLVELYPRHIETEDRRFFIPCMRYFSKAEQATMLEEMADFDKQFLHTRYRAVVEEYEGGDDEAEEA